MEQRIEFALKALRTLNFRALCQEYGVSAKRGYKWKERFLREGMGEESRRPKSSPEQLPEDEVCEMVRLKMAHLSWGPRKIRELYLRRHGEAASERSFKVKGWWSSGGQRYEPLTVRDEHIPASRIAFATGRIRRGGLNNWMFASAFARIGFTVGKTNG